MNKKNLIQTVKLLEKKEAFSVEIYILAQPEIENKKINIDYYKARMHEDVPSQIIDLFFPKLKKMLIDNDYELEKYDPTLMPDRNVVWGHEPNKVPFYKIFSEKINKDLEIKSYNNKLLPYGEIWAYWIKLFGLDETLYLIKKVTPSKVLKMGGLLALVFDGAFKTLVDDVLTMDGTFDTVYINRFLLFENKSNFEKALLYQEEKQVIAEKTLDEIEKIDFVDNFEEVKEYLKEDLHSINKLNKIKGRSYFKSLTLADVKRIVVDYGVDIEFDETSNKFHIASKQQAKYFIKVLNDDYLRSEMTNYKYSATSKESIKLLGN